MTTKRNIDKFIDEVLAIEARDALDAGRLGYYARVLAQATMPHSKPDANEHTRINGGLRLTMLSPSSIGLPYGSVPRLLMAWLTTEAVLTKSKQLYLGNSLTSFLRKVGMIKDNELPTGGKTGNISRVKNQARKLFNTTVSFHYDHPDGHIDRGFRVSAENMIWWDTAKSPDQKSLWESSVLLSSEFFDQITSNPIPIDLDTLANLKRSPLALDLYVWLTYRMSYLKKRTVIPWEVLEHQFGSDYKRTRAFKEKLIKELGKVYASYSDLRAAPDDQGLILMPSRPHIRKRGVSFMLTKDGS